MRILCPWLRASSLAIACIALTFTRVATADSRDVCALSSDPDTAQCFARVETNPNGSVQTFDVPNGLGPADLTSAYNVPPYGTSGTSTGIIAIVDAYDNPNVESDLATYRSTFGLPPCTSANGCFAKVNQRGASSPLPEAEGGWATEIALDTQLASAICPACRILLVEADTASMANLGAAVIMAVRLGASVVSNSWGGLESAKSVGYDRDYFTHDGVAIFASSGDSGYSRGITFPASGSRVIGVGGTTLVRDSSARGWSETVWGRSDTAASGTGSGCSQYIARPPWVNPADSPKCGAMKTVNDVAAVADPKTGVAVYNTYQNSGWTVIGGTSVGAPILAAIFVLTGKGAAGSALVWGNRTAFRDITTGTNANGTPAEGPPCDAGTDNLCNAVPGFDAPSGWGTPIASALLDVPFDGGPPRDAGPFPDVESPPPDAGPDATDPDDGESPDAGSDAAAWRPDPDASPGREPGPKNAADGDASDGGCTIADHGGASAGFTLASALFAAVTLRRRRRRG